MAEITKVREALVAQALDDIDQVVAKLEAVDQKIGASGEHIAELSDKLVQTTGELRKVLQDHVLHLNETADKAMHIARTREEGELRTAIAAAAETAVSKEIRESIDRMKGAIEALEAAATRQPPKAATQPTAKLPKNWPAWAGAIVVAIALGSALVGATTANIYASSLLKALQRPVQ
ncbi:hypothetical protein KDX27_39125 [Burkholderia cenocepacia]|uniref:hypothetical protein n=1 Tax=Burkholderia cenocepacia TaxID=95486 RepID=UPI001B96835F|nr:hypothetical protein [Burkholderia cenocepacia]MBR8029913.1 hypothetical protein [Burkholderia cenocepacia]MBR8173705.1 hypothetical protein [Burkholderia cenocepacia]